MSKLPATGLENVREALLSNDSYAEQVNARRRLAELAEELCLPMPPDVTDADLSEDMIRDAIADQVECVESRVPQMKGMVLKKWKNRGKMVLPLFFHTLIGKEWIRRLVFSRRFGSEQMALMLGIRAAQLQDYIRGQGWDRQVTALEREEKAREYLALSQGLLFKGKFKTMEAAVKLTSHIVEMAPEEGLRRIADLRALHGVMMDVHPPPKEGPQELDPSSLHAVNVGVTIVSHQKKTFDPAAAAKRAQAVEEKPIEPPTIESE